MEESEEEIQPRTAREVAERVLGILATIGKVYFPKENSNWIDSKDIYRYLTPQEIDFINCKSPTEQDKVNYSWRTEALASLIWSLNGLSEMPALNQQFDPSENAMVIKALRETEAFLGEASIRSAEELDEMESFLYHQHWRVRDHEFGFGMDQPDENDPDISQLHPGIVYERRYGMSWVVGFGDSWDDVPTDT